MQLITVINFKGGSGKTTTAAHLAQKLALDGYRVLAVDLDPQASLSALHGVQPEFDLRDGGTIYDAIRYDDPVPLRQVIQHTYFTNLDLIPGNLDLMEFEHTTPMALRERCAFHGSWASIPHDRGHLFHGIMGSHSRPRAGRPTVSWSQA